MKTTSRRFQSSGILVFCAFVIFTLLYMTTPTVAWNRDQLKTLRQDVPTNSSGRHRRSILQMCRMMGIFTGRNCLNYIDYSCFCGIGGEGTPVDDTDRCCQMHDECYGKLDCWFPSLHFIFIYSYRCTNNICRCTDRRACPRSKCECDLSFARCLQRSKHNPGNFDHNSRHEC